MKYEVSEKIAYLTFNRPERANALDVAGWEAMREAFERADADEEARVVILSGAGKHFCAGMDLSVLAGFKDELAGTQVQIEDQLQQFIVKIQDCITAIERCRKPVIAAVHGGCIGGGVDIVTACDMRYCSKDAYFTVKEVDLGIVADIGTLQRLPKIINPGLAAELAFTARRVDGKEAEQIGLVTACLGNEKQLLFRANQIADAIVKKPPSVIAGIKRNLLHQRDHSVADSLEYVARYSAGLMSGRSPE